MIGIGLSYEVNGTLEKSTSIEIDNDGQIFINHKRDIRRVPIVAEDIKKLNLPFTEIGLATFQPKIKN